jgi:DNA recombination protein RmuC
MLSLFSLLVSLITCVLVIFLVIRNRAQKSDALEKTLRDEQRTGREESSRSFREFREELAASFAMTRDSIAKTMGELGTTQQTRLDMVTRQMKDLTDANTDRIEKLRAVIDAGLRIMQESNEKKLEEMRKTVDEKLQGTLEKRLGESFKVVSERLEAVHRGLGEMQNLAAGVGDLKRVLTNVKARGTWAEFQLGMILEQILTPDQYARNVKTKTDSREVVEYAVRLPGAQDQPDSCVWLPIDSKFPQEDYQRLLDAAEKADAEAVTLSTRALLQAVRKAAQDIHDKYIDPPQTTDFAILFVPTEGLYAELLRQPGFAQELQNSWRIVVAGPATLAALLNSLHMGFRTLAIEKRASEVWKVLAAVKSEFGKFGAVLDKVKKQLSIAARTIDETGVRTRAMERHLRTVEQLPVDEAGPPLLVDDAIADELPEITEAVEEEDAERLRGD